LGPTKHFKQAVFNSLLTNFQFRRDNVREATITN